MIRTTGSFLAKGYEKFRAMKVIPARLGMTLVYGTPLLALTAGTLPYLSAPNAYQSVVFGALFAHFVKRLLESWFLHKYSGSTNPLSAGFVASFYSLTSFTPAYINRQPIADLGPSVYTGIGIFLIGETLNFAHHKILAGLRTNREYVIPHGGLFDRVVCPHYLFEIVSWFGMCLIFRHPSMFLFFSLMVIYLVVRSLFTLKWYRAQFPDFPPKRKAILPYIL